MKEILAFLEVENSSELCSYVYNHGNNPYFNIFRKKDIRKVDCSKEDWEKQGGYRYILCENSKAIKDQSEDYHNTCDILGLNFYKVMNFASSLDDSFEFAQNDRVPFTR